MYACLETSDLVAANWNTHQIRSAVDCCLRRLRRGRYVVTRACDNPSHAFVAAIAEAEETALPHETTGMLKRGEDLRILVRSFVPDLPHDAVFSHRSALLVHGLSVPYVDRGEVYVEVASPRSSVRQRDLVVRRRSLQPDTIEIVDGIPVTTVVQTLLDLARDCPLAFAVAVADAAVRLGRVSLEEFRAHQLAHPVRTRQSRISAVLENIDGRRETVAESICAVRFVEYSIPGFEPQLVVCDADGRFLARSDFGNEAVKVIAEFDGAGKYYIDDGDPHRAFERERKREYALRNEGWLVFRIRWADLFSADLFLRIKEAVRIRETEIAARDRLAGPIHGAQ